MPQHRPRRASPKSILRRASVSVITVLASFVLAFASDGHASVIDNFPSMTFLPAVGEPFSPYFAQTFKALPGFATAVAFELAGYFGSEAVAMGEGARRRPP